jgi:hypothetical protein
MYDLIPARVVSFQFSDEIQWPTLRTLAPG